MFKFSVTFTSQSALLCFNLLSPDSECPLSTNQLPSDSVLWAQSLTTNLPWVSLTLCVHLSLSRSLSAGLVTTEEDGENSGP